MKNVGKQYAGVLDKHQKQLPTKFAQSSYLANAEHIHNLIDWATFYRRNMHRFAQHYLGLQIYFYQAFLLYFLSRSTQAVVVAARAAAKSFIIAIFACCKAILYPNSQIVIASATKKQAKLIVTEKIERELMNMSPNLRKEIKRIQENSQDTRIDFWNGSTITVVCANDNARGHRSTLMIYEEFRMIDKNIIDSVLSQFSIVRSTGYKGSPNYASLPPEEAVSVYISSAWYRSHWMWGQIKDVAYAMSKDNESNFLCALDYCVSLFHKIKTKKMFIDLKRTLDPMTWAVECQNLMIGGNEHAFFTYDALAARQRLERPLYPRLEADRVAGKKNNYNLPHQSGEVRLLSCDMAFVSRKNNDNSIFSVIRLLPESTDINSEGQYRKQVVYMESIQGGDTTAQALRIKQLFYDLDCDYVVLDTRNAGISIYDMLARVMWDASTQTEYPPWQCMNDENIAARIRSIGAARVIFCIQASQRLNSDIAILTRQEFANGRVDLLIRHDDALDNVLSKNKDYTSAIEVDTQLHYERPYLETQAFINEAIDLSYERMPDTGIIKISERGVNTKDRYTSVSYGLYFASLLERENGLGGGEYEAGAFCN